MSDDDPISLADAATRFKLSKGVLKADGLRGRLAIYRLGRAYFTTPRAVREWVERCRVDPKVPACGWTPNVSNGLSGTDPHLSGLAALETTLSALKRN